MHCHTRETRLWILHELHICPVHHFAAYTVGKSDVEVDAIGRETRVESTVEVGQGSAAVEEVLVERDACRVGGGDEIAVVVMLIPHRLSVLVNSRKLAQAPCVHW